MKTPLETLRHHVTGAIERGEKQPIEGMTMKTKIPTHSQDWQGKMQVRPVVRGKVYDHREDLNVTLIQQGVDRFAVIYGLQVKIGLTYAKAATEYGCCIMHALACESKLDNSTAQ